MVHELKTWPEYFEAILEGRKNFELRRADRNFKVNDILRLKEFDPEVNGGVYTGREIEKVVSFILKGAPKFGLQHGYVIMSI